jgi:hypothetical protein
VTDKPNRKSAGQLPVSAHPAFPVIVALWFAALLGIGSMVLPLSMFENFAVASGLADAFEAAQPPLGATARIGLALVAAALGAVAGILVARKVAAANAQGAASRRAAALRPSTASPGRAAKRPISAHDELGEGGIDAADDEEPAPREAFAGRRRALAVTEESARSEFLAFAPLPGQSLNAEEEPLDLLSFEQPAALQPEAAAASDAPEREPERAARAQDFAFGSSILSTPAPHAQPVVHFGQAEARSAEQASFMRASEPEPQPGIAPPVAERALGELGLVELVERFAIALQRHREQAHVVAAIEPAVPDAPPPFIRAAESGPAIEPAEMPQERPLPVALRPFGFDEPLTGDADEGDEDEEGLPDFDFAAALSIDRVPFAAEPAGPDASDAPAGAEHDAALEDEIEEEIGETAEAEYTSLLAMKNPFGNLREPVRIDDLDEDDAGDEPVVVFPGQAARRASPAPDGPARDAAPGFGGADSARPFDAPLARAHQAASLGRASFAAPAARKPSEPGETERALRDALEKLQKMSGAA